MYRQTLYTLRKTQAAFGRFVPKDFLKLLGTGDILSVNLGDEVERQLTVMFTDIRNFTSVSEAMSSHETFEFLNAYLGHMEPAVQRHEGIIDKFIGDAVMALFPDRPEKAVEAAIAMREALHYYNERRVKDGYEPIQMGIGLNTGLTTLGVLGHLERMESTVIGDSVNVAQRIEGLTKCYRVGILISEDVLANLEDPNAFSIRFVDRVRVKGRIRPISVYEVFDGDAPELAKAKLACLEMFEKAVAYYHLREIEQALPLFQQCLDATEGDTVAEIYVDRCRRFLADGTYEGIGELLQQVEWLDSYNTGLEDVDSQHRTLLDNINKLAKAIHGDDASAVEEVFAFLARYAVEHFATEDGYMEKYGYPFRDEHRQEHDSFIRGFAATQQEILSGRHDRLIALFRINLFLYDWLISHSTRVDRHFADFVLKAMHREPRRGRTGSGA